MIEGAIGGEEHAFADNGGVRIHFASLGRNGPLLVLIHGFPDFWFTWRHQMPALAADHRVVAIDLRGYNLSDRPAGAENYDMPLLTGDVEAVIRHCGEERAIIIGHDCGGAIGWALATQRPGLVRGLIVLNLPHPACLLRELAGNPRQREASAYARVFQEEGAERTVTRDSLGGWIGTAEDRAPPAGTGALRSRGNAELLSAQFPAAALRQSLAGRESSGSGADDPRPRGSLPAARRARRDLGVGR